MLKLTSKLTNKLILSKNTKKLKEVALFNNSNINLNFDSKKIIKEYESINNLDNFKSHYFISDKMIG